MEITVKPAEKIEGRTRIPGDRDIAHRALVFSSLAENTIEIEGLTKTPDLLSTLHCLKELGVEFAGDGDRLKVKGKGLRGFKEPDNVLNVGGSESTAFLLTGLLAGQPFHTTLTGDGSLRTRSMKKVTDPLKQMGAAISGRHNSELLPLSIRGYDLLPISYGMPEAGSQLKSALLTAALFSRGVSEITDLYNTRDHTERALHYLGAEIQTGRSHIRLKNPAKLKGERFHIPGDISAALFLSVAATLAPHGELYMEDVGINPSRTGMLDILGRMGARISILNEREFNCEPVADLLVKSGRKLKGIEIKEEMMPQLMDDLPALIVAALFAEGDTVIKTSALPAKELDCLKSLTLELRKMGALLKELPPDTLVIKGRAKLNSACCESHTDHRITMAVATAALFAERESVIGGVESVQSSFPGFFDIMNRLV